MKRFCTLILTAALVLLCTLPALAQETRVFDRAGLFTPSQIQKVEQAIADFQTETGMDFVLLTSDEPHEGKSQQQISDAFYDQGGFGLDEEHSGVLYYIDMYDRIPYLSTTGRMIDYLTDERADAALESTWDALHEGRYERAALSMIAAVQNNVRRGIPEGQYRYDVVTGRRLTARQKALTGGELLLGALLAAVTGLVFVASVRSGYKLKGSTYRYDFRAGSRVRVTGADDTYLRTTTVRTRKSPPPSSGSSGGHSGGSGVHTSGGVSHGGRAGRSF